MSGITLKLEGVTKVYAGAVALQGVNLSICGGEVVGLVGENGAGKSTLMKVLGGTISPESGSIVIDGERLPALDPARATERGIAFVHQELNPFTNLDVTGNVLLGREIRRGWSRRMDRAAMERQVAPILKTLGTRYGPSDSVATLSLADQQLLEIARALSIDARLVVLDEPTSSLTITETNRLLEIIRQLRAKGVAILFISHRLAEIEAVADRVVVLRDGRNAGELQQSEISKSRITRMMIGRDASHFYVRQGHDVGQTVLEARGVTTQTYPHESIDLSLRAGEIFGLAGLVGAGRTELARALFGVDPLIAGEVMVEGRPLPPGSVAEAIAAGICLVPEDRKGQGLLLDFSIIQNIALPSLRRMSKSGIVDRAGEMALAERSRQNFAIKTSRLIGAVAELSGGNQQKVVLAKWLAMRPKVMILDEPTRGIDVGAKFEVYRAMHEMAGLGVAILMISSDMEEVIGVSDRVAVMRRGRIAGTLARSQLTEENILRLAME